MATITKYHEAASERKRGLQSSCVFFQSSKHIWYFHQLIEDYIFKFVLPTKNLSDVIQPLPPFMVGRQLGELISNFSAVAASRRLLCKFRRIQKFQAVGGWSLTSRPLGERRDKIRKKENEWKFFGLWKSMKYKLVANLNVKSGVNWITKQTSAEKLLPVKAIKEQETITIFFKCYAARIGYCSVKLS